MLRLCKQVVVLYGEISVGCGRGNLFVLDGICAVGYVCGTELLCWTVTMVWVVGVERIVCVGKVTLLLAVGFVRIVYVE